MKTISMVTIILFTLLICSDRLLAEPYITQSDVPAERGFRAVALLRGLEHPWGMAWLPNGDILVTERPGRLRRVRDGQLASGKIAGVPEVFDSGQGGLLDVSLHPDLRKIARFISLTRTAIPSPIAPELRPLFSTVTGLKTGR